MQINRNAREPRIGGKDADEQPGRRDADWREGYGWTGMPLKRELARRFRMKSNAQKTRKGANDAREKKCP